MSKEAMKLALEALERYQVKRQDFDRFADEITALREALAEQPRGEATLAQQEPVAWLVECGGDSALVRHTEKFPGIFAGNEFTKRPLVFCDTSPSAQQQEPVGTYGEIFESMRSLLRSGKQADQQIYMAMQDKPLYTSPPAQQEPVPSIIQMLGHCPECGAKAHHFTSPPAQRTWVGLTDEEIDKTHETKVWDARRSYARAIEAKLKEKNGL